MEANKTAKRTMCVRQTYCVWFSFLCFVWCTVRMYILESGWVVHSDCISVLPARCEINSTCNLPMRCTTFQMASNRKARNVNKMKMCSEKFIAIAVAHFCSASRCRRLRVVYAKCCLPLLMPFASVSGAIQVHTRIVHSTEHTHSGATLSLLCYFSPNPDTRQFAN